MSSQEECLSQRTAFHTAGSNKPIEVKQQSLARVAQILGVVAQENAQTGSLENENEFEGDEIDDDLVFSTVPQRSFNPTTAQIHFDEIDDDEMRRFAESFEQEQQDTKTDDNDPLDMDDDQLCQDYELKMQTPTKAIQMENKKRKEPCIEDLDALLNDDDDDDDEEEDRENQMEQPQQMSPVFKKKP